MKYLYTILGAAVLMGVLGYLVNSYGDSRYREGRGDAINAQTNTDMAHLVDWANQQKGINEQVLSGLNGLKDFQDSAAGPATHYSFDRVRESRKPSKGSN